jgi:hypothetical protein
MTDIITLGAINYKQLYVTAPITHNLQAVQASIKDDTPVYVKVTKGTLAISLLKIREPVLLEISRNNGFFRLRDFHAQANS